MRHLLAIGLMVAVLGLVACGGQPARIGYQGPPLSDGDKRCFLTELQNIKGVQRVTLLASPNGTTYNLDVICDPEVERTVSARCGFMGYTVTFHSTP